MSYKVKYQKKKRYPKKYPHLAGAVVMTADCVTVYDKKGYIRIRLGRW